MARWAAGARPVRTTPCGIIATHAERKSGYLVAIKLPSRHAQPLADATIEVFKRLPKRWRQTMTYDNGSEFADFLRIRQYTGLSIYFARPHACTVAARLQRKPE